MSYAKLFPLALNSFFRAWRRIPVRIHRKPQRHSECSLCVLRNPFGPVSAQFAALTSAAAFSAGRAGVPWLGFRNSWYSSGYTTNDVSRPSTFSAGWCWCCAIPLQKSWRLRDPRGKRRMEGKAGRCVEEIEGPAPVGDRSAVLQGGHGWVPGPAPDALVRIQSGLEGDEAGQLGGL